MASSVYPGLFLSWPAPASWSPLHLHLSLLYSHVTIAIIGPRKHPGVSNLKAYGPHVSQNPYEGDPTLLYMTSWANVKRSHTAVDLSVSAQWTVCVRSLGNVFPWGPRLPKPSQTFPISQCRRKSLLEIRFLVSSSGELCLIFFNYYFMCMGILPMYISVRKCAYCLHRPKDSVLSPRTGVSGNCESFVQVLEIDLSPLEEQLLGYLSSLLSHFILPFPQQMWF